jgi:methyl-accepting chemotaxis protein
MAETQANAIENILETHGAAASALARTYTSLAQDAWVTPETYKTLFREQIAGLPYARGVWSLINPGTGQAARSNLMVEDLALPGDYFGPSLKRDVNTGELSFSTMDISMEAGLKGWYLDPLAADKPVLNGPYLYKGEMYTSSTDIVRDATGKGIGLAGVDFNGAVFSDLIGSYSPMGTGWVRVVNHEGNWVVHPDPAMLGLKADDPLMQAAISGSAAGHVNEVIELDGEPWHLTAIKTDIARFGISWTVLVAVPEATLLADANAQRNSLLLGGMILLGLGLAAFAWLGNSIAKPIIGLTNTMDKLASGNLDVEVEGGSSKDEIGAMARAVAVFRENAIQISQMTEAEAARIIAEERQRREMMEQLQVSFGEVVDAAVEGDFSKRVHANFTDPELNGLAGSVNSLVETVDQGIAETGRVLAALANTDLTQRVEGNFKGAFAQLQSDTNAVSGKLTEVVGDAKEISRVLRTATSEILAGANDLSDRTTRQAATIEETSAAMSQLAETVRENAKMAQSANENARGAVQMAETTGVAMNQASDAMQQINASSAKISNIIGMIDDIAFQTNLLALNASVEAARAGEAGKGFAVVAVEVRRLAQSSAEASTEIKQLIEQSVNEVKGGTRLVAGAAEKLATLLAGARDSERLMMSIAQESSSQASAIEQVNVAVRQMDEMTQHNAALVEEMNASIEQTESQAAQLDQTVEVFTLEPARVGRPAPSAAPRPMQGKPRAAAAYLSSGNAAIDQDWAEF